MKTIVLFACASALVGPAFGGDQGVMIRERARGVSQQVTARDAQALGPGAAATPAPTLAQPAAPPANPALVATEQNISNIANDLGLIKSDPSRKQALINDLNAAAQGKSPSKATVEKLAGDLGAVFTDKSFSPEQRTRLAQYLRASFNSSHLSAAQQKMVAAEAQKILTGAGVSSETAVSILADLKSAMTEAK